MKLQFKRQQYQTDAVDSVVGCFVGQPFVDLVSYQMDPGNEEQTQIAIHPGLRNHEIQLSDEQVFRNIRRIQKDEGLAPSESLVKSKAGPINLDIEMETGTGKTYVYIKTMMELNRRYGWSKFIVVVPSIAIREGVKKSFDITADHFQDAYGKRPRSFIYNSKQLHELESFSSDAGVQVMIINIQAFLSAGKDNRRIYDELDDFQSRKPIDVIAANRPIVIIDEPQKIGSPKSLEALSNFEALFVLRYSATHKKDHNKIHRLDAVDAYREKLVKKIAVRGITVRGLVGTSAYLYLDGIEVSTNAPPAARVELEIQGANSIRRQVRKLTTGSNLHDISNGLEAYKDLFVTDIDATRDVIELSNGDEIFAGQITDDVTEEVKRRIQIREVIRAHLEKERELFAQGVKVLSLFFVDEVVKYRDYDREDTLGDYARMFEEEYELALEEHMGTLPLDGTNEETYRKFLERDAVGKIHEGYFSVDKKTKAFVDNEEAIKKSGDEKGLSTDVDAYDLILRDKERLLSRKEPVRFIFSHSALREGWDSPNVFVIGMLKKSDNTISRRQEIGRGLRLAVNQQGERMDDPETVHDINELTVVTDESYTDFVTGLQKEIVESLSARPREASEKYFLGRTFDTETGKQKVDGPLAKALYFYLAQNSYIDEDGLVTDSYKEAREAGELAGTNSEALAKVAKDVFSLVDELYLDIPKPENARKPKRIPLNEENFAKKEFQELWGKINHRAVYQVEFDSDELIGKSVAWLDKSLRVSPLQYVVELGEQLDEIDADDLEKGEGFAIGATATHAETVSASSQVKYDLIGEITEKTQLTRRTAARILAEIKSETFAMYRQNPEQFITETARLINEQKATVILEHLSYDPLEDRFDSAIFTENQTKQDFAKAGEKLRRHVYDYAVTDSKKEREFVTTLDTSSEVEVYAKLPRGFFIPTPIGNYNPDWAIAFKEGKVKHVYFVAETKGSLSTLDLKGAEEHKIECARKFFHSLNGQPSGQEVKYDVVTSYLDLMEMVGVK
jgi:type III restriction enzyme